MERLEIEEDPPPKSSSWRSHSQISNKHTLIVILVSLVLLTIVYGLFKIHTKVSCVSMDYEEESCDITLSTIRDENQELRFYKNSTEMEKFINLCMDFHIQCLGHDYCWESRDVVQKELQWVSKFCNSADEYFLKHLNCWEKVEGRNSDCMEKWRSFDKNYTETEQWKTDEVKEECGEFFNEEGGCLKNEIVETCGEGKWKNYAEFMKTDNRIPSTCQYYWWYLK